MAKIKDLKIEINGEHFTIHVNCGSDGWFSANLPEKVASALDLQKKMHCQTLELLEKDITAAIKRYKEAKTAQEVMIGIRYLSGGKFNANKEGNCLHSSGNDKFQLSLSWSNEDVSGLVFHFDIFIKETIDTIVKWHKAVLGKDFPYWDKEEQAQPDTYFKRGEIHDPSKYKMIPFSPGALQSLQNAQEKIRAVSELLYDFITQDEEQIQIALTKTNLLNG